MLVGSAHHTRLVEGRGYQGILPGADDGGGGLEISLPLYTRMLLHLTVHSAAYPWLHPSLQRLRVQMTTATVKTTRSLICSP